MLEGGRTEEALALLDLAVAGHLRDWRIHFGRAVALARVERWLEARTALFEAAELRPGVPATDPVADLMAQIPLQPLATRLGAALLNSPRFGVTRDPQDADHTLYVRVDELGHEEPRQFRGEVELVNAEGVAEWKQGLRLEDIDDPRRIEAEISSSAMITVAPSTGLPSPSSTSTSARASVCAQALLDSKVVPTAAAKATRTTWMMAPGEVRMGTSIAGSWDPLPR